MRVPIQSALLRLDDTSAIEDAKGPQALTNGFASWIVFVSVSYDT